MGSRDFADEAEPLQEDPRCASSPKCHSWKRGLGKPGLSIHLKSRMLPSTNFCGVTPQVENSSVTSHNSALKTRAGELQRELSGRTLA